MSKNTNTCIKQKKLDTWIDIRHGNGAGWGRVLPSPSPYPIPIYLPVTLHIPSVDEKSNLISVPDGFWYPRPIPIPTMDNFFKIKIKVFFSPKRNVVMHYPAKIWWWSMTKVIEKREARSVRYGRRKERTMISECHLTDWDSDCMSEMI